MPAIEDLFGLWGSFRRSIEIADPTISTDDLNATMSEKPIGKHLLIAAQKDLNRSVVLQISQERSCTAHELRNEMY